MGSLTKKKSAKKASPSKARKSSPAPKNKSAAAKAKTPGQATAKKAASKAAKAAKGAPGAKATKAAGSAVKEPERSAPPLAEVDAEVLEFIAAIDRFKQENGRPFPSWSEVLLIVRDLGYRRSAP